MKQKSPLPKRAIPIASIEQRIFMIRGQKVILDADLAQLYGVTTKRLNEQVKRNQDRFPDDFMFRLSSEEGISILASRSQIATLKRGQNLKYAPYAFTEHGAVMVANVLNSPIAVQASIQVVRAFVRLREIMAANKELAQKLEQMEKKYDRQFKVVFDAIRELMILPILSTKHCIGFFDWSPNKLNRDSNETPLCIFQEFFSIFEGNRGNCAHRPGRFISSPLILSPALRPPSFFGSLDQVSGQFSVGSLLA